MIRTINDILKSSEGSNKEVDKVLISNCRMLLSVGFCKEESYLKAIKTAHRLGLDKKEKVKVIDFVIEKMKNKLDILNEELKKV